MSLDNHLSEEIKNKYIKLLELIRYEADFNPSIWDYFNYLTEYKQKFINASNVSIREELKEFLRGANRYSDEFSFSDENYYQIRNITNRLYDILNSENPI